MPVSRKPRTTKQRRSRPRWKLTGPREPVEVVNPTVAGQILAETSIPTRMKPNQLAKHPAARKTGNNLYVIPFPKGEGLYTHDGVLLSVKANGIWYYFKHFH